MSHNQKQFLKEPEFQNRFGSRTQAYFLLHQNIRKIGLKVKDLIKLVRLSNNKFNLF